MRTVVSKASQIVFSLLVLLGIGAFSSFAQLPTATILGTVRDSTGAVIPGVNVTVRNIETGATRTTTSAANGSYRVVALAVGTYEVRAEQPGFRAEERSGLTLAVDQEAVVNFSLQVGQVEQTVEVTAEAPVVNTTSGTLGDLVNERQIQELPINGRNYINLTLMQPGVQENLNGRDATGAGTLISVNGAPTRSNNYLLDGAALVNDRGTNSASATGATLGTEGIREWKIVTNQYSAEYGMRMGSQMTIVSKGGTNDLHGTLFEYMRNAALDARNFFDYKSEASQRRLPAFTRNQFGGSVGGPILRDKLFFFATYEGLRERKGLSLISQTMPVRCRALTNNPCITSGPNGDRERRVNGRQNLEGNINPVIAPIVALYPLPNLPEDRFTYAASDQSTDDYGQIRGDWNIGANDSFFVRYNNTPANAVDALDFAPFIGTRESNRHILSASDNHIFSPSLLGTFRYSVTLYNQNNDSPMPDALDAYSLVVDGKTPEGRGLPRVNPGGNVTILGPQNNAPAPRDYDTHTWSADMFYTRGNHSFKFGTLVNRLFQDNTHGNQYFGTITGGNLSRFLNGDPQTLQAQGPDIYNNRQYRWWTYGFYMQDDFRATPNLTLNLGFRYEFHTTYRAPNGIESSLRDINDDHFTVGPLFKNPTLTNFSPRLGFAWDVKGNGMTAVRGGFALLYDLDAHGSTLGNMPSAQPPFSRQVRVSSPARASGGNGQFTLPFVTWGTSAAVRTPEWEIQSPHLLQYSLTVDRQLPLGMGLSLGFNGSRGLNLAKSVEGNPLVPLLGDPRGAGQPGGYYWEAPLRRLNPVWATIQYHTGSSNSWYNSLQAVVRKPIGRGLQFQGSYVWSKALDESQSQDRTDQGGDYFPWLRLHDRGLAVFHFAHTLRANSIYRIPLLPFNGVADKVLNGWWVSGILSMQTGNPFDVGLTGDRSRCDCSDRPNVFADRSNDNIILGGPDRYFDPSAFFLQPVGTLGNMGRHALIGPGMANLDFSIAKDTSVGFLGEAGKLEFRADIFNIFNRSNFRNPDRDIGSNVFEGTGARAAEVLDAAGRIDKTSTTSRQIQLALRLIF